MNKLFFARKNGVTVAHNLTSLEVEDMRLADTSGKLVIYEQSHKHSDLIRPAFCHECAETAGEIEEFERTLFMLSVNAILPTQR